MTLTLCWPWPCVDLALLSGYLPDLHGDGDLTSGEHVDCYDGPHLRDGLRHGEGMVQTGEVD